MVCFELVVVIRNRNSSYIFYEKKEISVINTFSYLYSLLALLLVFSFTDITIFILNFTYVNAASTAQFNV